MRMLAIHDISKSAITCALAFSNASAGTQGILYVLSKVHKDNSLARPKLSAIGTYDYKIVKFLLSIMQPFTINEYTVKNTPFCFLNDFI